MQGLSYLTKIKNNFMQRLDLPNFKFFKVFKNKKLLFAVVLVVIAAGLIFPSGDIYAATTWNESVGGFVLDLIAPLIYLVFYVFFYVAYLVSLIGASMINMTLNPAIINSVLDMRPTGPLYQAWTIFRDVANLLFILILLLIALGTIFRAESYNIKKSLYKFILIIFLINFSAMIAGLFIDFGNFLMYGVLKMMCTSGSNQCFQDFYSQLTGVTDKLFWKYSITGISFDFKDAAAIGIAAIYTFIYGLVLMALGIFLLIRIAALAILIIISPLAFFGYTAPGLAGLKTKWWDNLVQYVMFGPVFALMLYISGLMAQNMMAVNPAIFEANPNLSWMAQDITMILTSIIPLIFLIGIIPVTRAFGIAGSDAILKYGGFGLGVGAALGATKWLGGATDRYLARGAGMKAGKGAGILARGGAWMRRQGAYLSPGAWKKAGQAHQEEGKHDYDIAGGKIRTKVIERVTDWPNWKKRKLHESSIDHEFNNEISDIYRKNKDIMATDKDTNQLIFEKKRAYAQGDYQTAMAYDLAIGAKGDADDLITAHEYKDENGNTVRYNNSDEDFIRYFKNEYASKVGEKLTDYIQSQVAVLDEKGSGNKAWRDTVYFDEKEGRIKARDIFNSTLTNTNPENPGETIGDTEHEKMLAKQKERFKKDEPQKAMSQLNERTFMDQIIVKKVDAKTGEVKLDKTWKLKESGENIIADMTNQYFVKMNRPKGQKLKNILDGVQRAEKEYLRDKFKEMDKKDGGDREKRLDRFIEEAEKQLAAGEERGKKKGSKTNRETVRRRELERELEEEEESTTE